MHSVTMFNYSKYTLYQPNNSYETFLDTEPDCLPVSPWGDALCLILQFTIEGDIVFMNNQPNIVFMTLLS